MQALCDSSGQWELRLSLQKQIKELFEVRLHEIDHNCNNSILNILLLWVNLLKLFLLFLSLGLHFIENLKEFLDQLFLISLHLFLEFLVNYRENSLQTMESSMSYPH